MAQINITISQIEAAFDEHLAETYDPDTETLNTDAIKQFYREKIQELQDERDKYWATMLEAHRPYCSSQGNKELTKVKRHFKITKALK